MGIRILLLVLSTSVVQHTAVLLGNSSTLNKRGENPPRCNRTTPAVFSLANPSVNAQTIFSFSAVMAFHEALTSSYQQYGEPPEQLSVMQRAHDIQGICPGPSENATCMERYGTRFCNDAVWVHNETPRMACA